jgi:hypothetical protein
MVRAQAVDAVEVLRYNGRASGKGGGQVLRQLKYFQSVVRLCSFSQATEENYLSQSAISQQMQALVANDELYAVQAASTEPLEEADPAGLVLFHALGSAQNLMKAVLIQLYNFLGHSLLSPFECLCGNFILPEPASYVFFYAFSNLRSLLYIIRTKYPTKLA